MYQTVARYFCDRARKSNVVANLGAPPADTNNAISLEANALHTDIGPILPDASQNQTAAGNEKDDIDHDRTVAANKVTAFNDVLRPTQITSKLSQCPVQMKINLISSFQKTDLILNKQLENITNCPGLIAFSLLLIKNIITLFFTNSIKWFTECLNSDTLLSVY